MLLGCEGELKLRCGDRLDQSTREVTGHCRLVDWNAQCVRVWQRTQMPVSVCGCGHCVEGKGSWLRTRRLRSSNPAPFDACVFARKHNIAKQRFGLRTL